MAVLALRGGGRCGGRQHSGRRLGRWSGRPLAAAPPAPDTPVAHTAEQADKVAVVVVQHLKSVRHRLSQQHRPRAAERLNVPLIFQRKHPMQNPQHRRLAPHPTNRGFHAVRPLPLSLYSARWQRRCFPMWFGISFTSCFLICMKKTTHNADGRAYKKPKH